MTVIDLGELTHDQGPAPPAPPVRLDRRLFRQVAIVAIAVLTVLGATGSTASVRHNLRPLWTTAYGDGSSMTLDDTSLYAGRIEDGSATFSAFDLATGRKRWTVPTGVETVTPMADVDGVLIMPETVADLRIPQDDGTFMVQTSTSSTTARDAATGRALWTLPGSAIEAYPGSVLMGLSDRNGRLAGLRVVGLRDGGTRWRRSLRDIDVWGTSETGGTPARVLLGDRSGLLTVIDYADGSTVRTGRVSGFPWPGAGEGYAALHLIDDRLVITRADDRSHESVVYRLDDFRELWRFDGFVMDCGSVLCSMRENGLAGHDPDTGRQLWFRSDLNGVWPLAGGRFLGNGPSPQGPYQLVDPLTGRGVGDTVRGEPTWNGGAPSGAVLLVGVVPGDYHRSTVVQLDLGTGRSYLLGAIGQAGHFGCLSVPGYLACGRPGGIEVTAVG